MFYSDNFTVYYFTLEITVACILKLLILDVVVSDVLYSSSALLLNCFYFAVTIGIIPIFHGS